MIQEAVQGNKWQHCKENLNRLSWRYNDKTNKGESLLELDCTREGKGMSQRDEMIRKMVAPKNLSHTTYHSLSQTGLIFFKQVSSV